MWAALGMSFLFMLMLLVWWGAVGGNEKPNNIKVAVTGIIAITLVFISIIAAKAYS